MSKTQKLIAGLIITVSAMLAVASGWGDSPVVDEIPHIGAGYSYLVKQDYRLNPEHPPLAKDLAALPLLFLNLKQDAFQTKPWLTDINGQWEFGRNLIYETGNDATLITHLVKLPMLLFLILSAILVFFWAYQLYGQIGAFTALILFAFSPTIIAHSRFVTTDMAALWGSLYATYFFIRYLKNQSKKNAAIAALFFALALLVKFSTILLIPFWGILALAYGWYHAQDGHKFNSSVKYGIKSVVIMALGFIFIVWPVYYLHTYNYPAERQQRDTQYILTSIYGESYTKYSFVLDPVVHAAGVPVIRAPAQYFLGLLRVLHQTNEPHDTYFLGQVNTYGSHAYFPIIYFIKEPLAWWILVLIALIFLGTQLNKPSKESFKRSADFIKNNFIEFAMILWLIIYWTASINSTLNIGVRHLLPTYPFAIILISGLIAKLVQKSKIKNQNYNSKFKNFNLSFYTLIFTLCILLGWYIVEDIKIYPYYLAYFNQTVGGPSQAYQYVTDSNLDWGQDLRRLADWVQQNNIPRIETDYFGWADPAYYMGSHYIWTSATKYQNARDFIARNQSDGWLAVSATFLQGSQGSELYPKPVNYLWLNSYKPVAVIGYSIFIYHIK